MAYVELGQVVSDLGNDERAATLDWLGIAQACELDPKSFNLSQTNLRLRAMSSAMTIRSSVGRM